LFSNPHSENMSHIMNGKEVIKFRLVEGSFFSKTKFIFRVAPRKFLSLRFYVAPSGEIDSVDEFFVFNYSPREILLLFVSR
jgi:hypothetical protein